MLKRDTNGKFYYKEVGFFNKKKRFLFKTGKNSTEPYLDEEQYKSLLSSQQIMPVRVMRDTSSKKIWWMFKNEFYWEDEGYSITEVKALILDRLEQKKRKIDRAIVRISQSVSKSANGRDSISDDVKQFVWQRDGGCCVKCKSQEKLEYDHIIPLAKGGSNTARNLQLLCEECNRSKGAHLF
jgi:hypothetical protein